MSDLEKINFYLNGQWCLEKRCWEGYKSVPGKRAYSEGSCEPVKKDEDAKIAPQKSKNRKTYLEIFEKTNIQIEIYDNKDIDLLIGEEVPESTEKNIVNSILQKGFLEQLDDDLIKKEWSPKAEHKSDKGGLTAKGRESYNRATGGNLKAPQPEGGPRKRSFCARNKGQIDMHDIDCKKTPDKRACKARRRWKC